MSPEAFEKVVAILADTHSNKADAAEVRKLISAASAEECAALLAAATLRGGSRPAACSHQCSVAPEYGCPGCDLVPDGWGIWGWGLVERQAELAGQARSEPAPEGEVQKT